MTTTESPYTVPQSVHNGRTVFHALTPHTGSQSRPYERFRRSVKWPHSDRAWLAARLGTSADDPRLELRAIKAALRGEIHVYVTKDNQIGDWGSPKERR
jgi:hypothetical protein